MPPPDIVRAKYGPGSSLIECDGNLGRGEAEEEALKKGGIESTLPFSALLERPLGKPLDYFSHSSVQNYCIL